MNEEMITEEVLAVREQWSRYVFECEQMGADPMDYDTYAERLEMIKESVEKLRKLQK